MEIHVDLIDGATLSEGRDGIATTRTAIVEGLTGDGHAKLYAALRADGVPQRGDYHPSIPGIQVDTVYIQSVDLDKVTLSINYRRLDASDLSDGVPTVSVGGGLSAEKTNEGADGEPLVRYYDVVDFDADGNPTGHRIVGYLEAVDVERPMVAYVVRVRLPYSPMKLAMKYKGTLGSFPGVEGSWFCRDIGGDSSDGGETYDCYFEFMLPPKGGTWSAMLPERDPKDGWKIKAGGTYIQRPVYTTEDFSALPIPGPV